MREFFKKNMFWLLLSLKILCSVTALFLWPTKSDWSVILLIAGVIIYLAIDFWMRCLGAFCSIRREELQEGFLWKNKVLFLTRLLRLALAIFLILIVNTKGHTGIIQWLAKHIHGVSKDWIKGIGLVSFSIVLVLDLCDIFVRMTFRMWPSYVLGIAAGLLFLVCMGLPYSGTAKAWGIVDLTNIVEKLDKIPTQIKSSVIIIGLASFIVYIAKDYFSRRKDKLYGNTIKDTRRQLLSHWYFRPEAPLLSNTIAWIVVGFTIACLTVIFLSFSPDKSNSIDPSVSVSISVENDGDDAKIHGELESVQADDGDGLTAMEYLAVFALVFSAIGILGHLEISDKALVECEYYYLLYHALYLRRQSLNKKKNKWEDYFQVLAYMYYGSSPINSEAEEWHDIKCVLKFIYDGTSSRSEEEKRMFLARFVSSCIQIKAQYGQHNDSNVEDNNKYKILHSITAEHRISQALQEIISWN